MQYIWHMPYCIYNITVIISNLNLYALSHFVILESYLILIGILKLNPINSLYLDLGSTME